RYRTTRVLPWEIGRKGSGLWVEVPPGTAFDVSIPRPLWWAFDPHDPRYLKAAALHDELLKLGWDRVTAAAVFHCALVADGVPRARRLAMLLAVMLWRYR
ncbi:MAG TPA: hypothetical protein DC031_01320, partial [Sulfitobacter sp.]|nr:hypothetical protein [Sulfitobacter sp.]